jgi:predicted HicB family RNase H-like nuclease
MNTRQKKTIALIFAKPTRTDLRYDDAKGPAEIFSRNDQGIFDANWSKTMKNTMKYKGYTGSVAFDAEDRIFHGRVLGVSSALIGFEGATVADLEKDFQNAVDDYLELCAEQGKEPEKPFKGSFNIRLSPDLHQSLVLNAANQKMTLNAYIKTVLEQVVHK